MPLKFVWPGKMKNASLRSLQDFYLERIRLVKPCRIIETREAKGLEEKHTEKIKEIEAGNLEKHLKDDYIICLFDKGKTMNSEEFARFLEKCSMSSAGPVTFVVGGFLGLGERILERADFLLSLSRMTFSHELSRIILLEQVYRALMIRKGRHYAK